MWMVAKTPSRLSVVEWESFCLASANSLAIFRVDSRLAITFACCSLLSLSTASEASESARAAASYGSSLATWISRIPVLRNSETRIRSVRRSTQAAGSNDHSFGNSWISDTEVRLAGDWIACMAVIRE